MIPEFYILNIFLADCRFSILCLLELALLTVVPKLQTKMSEEEAGKVAWHLKEDALRT